MSLELIEQISLPGSAARPNEDSFAFLDTAALVMDGGTFVLNQRFTGNVAKSKVLVA